MRRLLAVLVVAGALAACATGTNNYGKGTEAAFLETCTVHQQQPGPICSCIYTEITQRIPYDRYVELDKSMQKDDKFVPDELVSIAADCASRLTTTTTESTTTTTTESTTTTTSTTSTTTTTTTVPPPTTGSSSSSSSRPTASSSTFVF